MTFRTKADLAYVIPAHIPLAEANLLIKSSVTTFELLSQKYNKLGGL